MADMEEKKEETTAQPLRGRAAWLDRYRKDNPDLGEVVDDEDLFEYANGGYSDKESKYDQLNEANGRLAELMSNDPKLAAALTMVAGKNRKSLPYAIGSVFGKDWLDGDLEEFEAGYQENLKRLAESEKLQAEATKNIEKSMESIEKYVSDNQLSEEDASQLNENIVMFAENLLMGIIPPELIELVHKGQSYDQDIESAMDTAAVEAKNERIEPELKKLTEKNDAIDLGGAASSNKNRPAPRKKGGSFYDGLKEGIE